MKLIKKVTSLLLILAMATVSTCVVAFAETNTDNLSDDVIESKLLESEYVVSGYLNAMKSEDYTEATSLIVDSRMSAEQLEEFYGELPDEKRIADYGSIDYVSFNDGIYKFNVNIEFSDGHFENIMIYVACIGNEYKIVVTPDTVEVDGINSIGNIQVENNANNGLATAASLLDSWEFTGLWSTMYGLDEFTITKTKVTLNVNQYPQSPPAYEPQVKYAIVDQGVFSDTIWGQANISGVGSYSATITKSSSVSNPFTGKIRISRMNGDDYSFVNGSGSLYQ